MVLLGRITFGSTGLISVLGAAPETLRFFQGFQGRLGEPLLLLVVEKNRGTVLVAHVAELSVLHEGIDVVPEDVEELRVSDLQGIDGDFYGFRVTRPCRKRPLQYVRGIFVCPPVYPGVTETPSSLSKTGSMHQKQPPAKVAFPKRWFASWPASCPLRETAMSAIVAEKRVTVTKRFTLSYPASAPDSAMVKM